MKKRLAMLVALSVSMVQADTLDPLKELNGAALHEADRQCVQVTRSLIAKSLHYTNSSIEDSDQMRDALLDFFMNAARVIEKCGGSAEDAADFIHAAEKSLLNYFPFSEVSSMKEQSSESCLPDLQSTVVMGLEDTQVNEASPAKTDSIPLVQVCTSPDIADSVNGASTLEGIN